MERSRKWYWVDKICNDILKLSGYETRVDWEIRRQVLFFTSIHMVTKKPAYFNYEIDPDVLYAYSNLFIITYTTIAKLSFKNLENKENKKIGS